MGRLPTVTQLVRGRGRNAPISCGPRALVFTTMPYYLLEKHLPWSQCPMQGIRWERKKLLLPLLSQHKPFSVPAGTQLLLLLFCPLSSPPRPLLKFSAIDCHPLGTTDTFISQGSSAFGSSLIWFLTIILEIIWIYSTFSTKLLK